MCFHLDTEKNVSLLSLQQLVNSLAPPLGFFIQNNNQFSSVKNSNMIHFNLILMCSISLVYVDDVVVVLLLLLMAAVVFCLIVFVCCFNFLT